jgi:hypothetical protein
VRTARQDTVLPGGGLPAAVVAGESGGQTWAVVRVGDRLCVGHPGWMDLATAREFAAALFELGAEGSGAE